jgi:K(+)-stimulated pyrophosphate-energized sodium pump
LAGILSLVFAGVLTKSTLSKEEGTDKMKKISLAIRKGALAFLNRQYQTIAVFTVVITVIMYLGLGYVAAISFVAGALLSALSGYIGMMVSVHSNARTANAANASLSEALNVSFRGGAVNGFSIVGLGILGVSLLFVIFRDPDAIIGFAFGASLVSLFARVGGGIYTKAADVGADLVGKVEKGIPEDDPRNPAVIADNVGDNVGDCSGMGADLFESYVVTLIAAMVLGSIIFGLESPYVLFPLIIGAVGIFASIIGSLFVRTSGSDEKSIWAALYRGEIIAALLTATGVYYFATSMFENGFSIFIATLSGIVTSLLIGYITEYYTSREKPPVKEIANASTTGAGTNIISGISIGLKSTTLPVLIIVLSILVSNHFAGLYGIGLAAMGLLSITAIIMAIDTYGPITDNAGGIAEMAGMPSNVRKTTDTLDAVGNTTKATTKGVAIASAAISALVLFSAFVNVSGLKVIDVLNVNVLVGLFMGAAIPFLFSGYTMNAVAKAANLLVIEVRRQFKEIKGIMQGKAEPDYEKAVDICTRGALRELIVPGVIAVSSPILIGIIFGIETLAGVLAGSIVSGLLLALFFSNAGASWDNAKKYIEIGNLGGKGSEAHKAAVIGDTVGDPFKDTSGPAINPLIKVLNTISTVFIPLILAFALV